MSREVSLTGNERIMGDSDVIVSKTNLKGHITYGNNVFCDIAGYTVKEIMNAPHSLIRHPDMPRCVFKFLWDQIQAKNEVFAYVVNRSKNGDHYWVFAHVTPTFDAKGDIIAYHSSRRKPSRESVNIISGLYKALVKEEQRHHSRKEGMKKSFEMLVSILEDKKLSYDEFVFSI